MFNFKRQFRTQTLSIGVNVVDVDHWTPSPRHVLTFGMFADL